MNICEGCIKQDVCRFKNEVEKYEGKQMPEPLEPIIQCKYKQTGSCTWTTTTVLDDNNTLTDCYPTGTCSGFN